MSGATLSLEGGSKGGHGRMSDGRDPARKEGGDSRLLEERWKLERSLPSQWRVGGLQCASGHRHRGQRGSTDWTGGILGLFSVSFFFLGAPFRQLDPFYVHGRSIERKFLVVGPGVYLFGISSVNYTHEQM